MTTKSDDYDTSEGKIDESKVTTLETLEGKIDDTESDDYDTSEGKIDDKKITIMRLQRGKLTTTI